MRCKLNSVEMHECAETEMSLIQFHPLNPAFFFFFFFLKPKQLHSTSLIELHQQRWKKQSGARAEKEKVWEVYWLAAPGGEHPPHHTSWQHLPQGIHLNVIWQPSAISKLNLDIDLDTQFQGLTTLLRFHTHSQTLICLSCWERLLVRPYTM